MATSNELKKQDNRKSHAVIRELIKETEKKIEKAESKLEKMQDRVHELQAILREESS